MQKIGLQIKFCRLIFLSQRVFADLKRKRYNFCNFYNKGIYLNYGKGEIMKENRGVGRPPVADKAKPRSIKVNDREWKAIKSKAEMANKTIARYLIDLALQ